MLRLEHISKTYPTQHGDVQHLAFLHEEADEAGLHLWPKEPRDGGEIPLGPFDKGAGDKADGSEPLGRQSAEGGSRQGARGRPGDNHFDEPTKGIDVGAKQEIYQLMNTLAEAGKAIIMISSDMEEILGMSDRIVVLHEGTVAGELHRDEFSQERVLQLASGM